MYAPYKRSLAVGSRHGLGASKRWFYVGHEPKLEVKGGLL